ncbi:hypothetical protein GGTG_02772 [Gaeumannomyces tritici R3-111a-1]|uniref:Uncharacterized protein n=1 Tax=Gaeumannomyces tritici (strain R3-111a-1) TaxID=644352 RepID=J3NNB6_GAET3|nr:hypothetical protein GGTG_02772 [Gaeumannomyces tritici R3-111a-1]EJT77668.1 hypothetical protein GGTG_02772 [Gaeumannomyces tritici R3-111a-1]
MRIVLQLPGAQAAPLDQSDVHSTTVFPCLRLEHFQLVQLRQPDNEGQCWGKSRLIASMRGATANARH